MAARLRNLVRQGRRLRNDSGGTVAVEFGFAMPILILFTVGLIDLSMLLWSASTIENAGKAEPQTDILAHLDVDIERCKLTIAASDRALLHGTIGTTAVPNCRHRQRIGHVVGVETRHQLTAAMLQAYIESRHQSLRRPGEHTETDILSGPGTKRFARAVAPCG